MPQSVRHLAAAGYNRLGLMLPLKLNGEVKAWLFQKRWGMTRFYESLSVSDVDFSSLSAASLLHHPCDCTWMRAKPRPTQNRQATVKSANVKSGCHNPLLLLLSVGIRFTVGVTSWSMQGLRENRQSPRRGSGTWAKTERKRQRQERSLTTWG